MLSLLDVQTVLFSYVISDAVCVIVLFSLWRANARRSPETEFWLVGIVLQFVAILLISLRGVAPDVFSIVAGSSLVLAGIVLIYIGLERHLRRPSDQRRNYLLLALFVCVISYFTFVQPSLLARTLSFSLGLLLICAQIAWLTLGSADAGARAGTRFVGVIFAAYGLVSIGRAAADLVVLPGNDLWSVGPLDTLAILIYQMLTISATFGLFLLVNRRMFAELEQDIQELERAGEELRQLSLYDSLTGLYSRRLFEEELARLERGRQYPVSLMMFDVDGLKAINDRDGHAAGDELLRRMAQVFGAVFRADDVVARIGGDEFAVLLPRADAATAEAALARVRKIVLAHNASYGGTALRVSIGVSTAEKGDSLAATLAQADERMYQDKRGKQLKVGEPQPAG